MIQALYANEAASPPGTRFEWKLTADRSELYRVQAWLRAHPAGFSPLYPSRRINSIYFDTPEQTSYHENLAGVARRWKIRLRWYGADLTRADGTLEIKRKQGLVGWKPQYRLPEPLTLADTTWSAVRGALRGQVPDAWRACLDRACCPFILTSYTRTYDQSADGLVRATVDFDQAVYDQRRSVRPNLQWRSALVDRVVIELKCAVAHYDRLAEVAGAFPIRVDRHSKYVAGIQATRW